MPRPAALRLAALLMPLGLAACGTTVPLGAAVPGEQAPALLPASPVAGAGAVGAGAVARSPGRAGSVQPPAAATAPSSVVPLPPGPRVAGASARALRVGTYYFDAATTNSLISSVGAHSEMGDMRAQQRAVAAWINSHGGVAGRRLELVQHLVDIQADQSAEAQRLCAAWTQGKGVYAGIGSLPTANPVLVSCLARARTLAIGGSSSNVGTAQDFRRWAPYYYAPASMELVTAGRVYAKGLLEKGFFGGGAKVGVVYVETTEHEASLRQGLLPELSRAGVEVEDTVGVSYDGSLADYGHLVTQAQSATLRFRSRGVTHVLFVDTGGALAYWFLQQAQSQGWHPRYGLSTLSAPAFQEANVDPRQLRGAVAVGWRPADDVTQVGSAPANPARTRCQQLMRAAGLPPRSAFDLQLQLTTCSGLLFLKAAADRAATLAPEAFAAAAAGLGETNVPSASGFVDSYAPGKPWGGWGYATASFVDACACFRYDGRTRRL